MKNSDSRYKFTLLQCDLNDGCHTEESAIICKLSSHDQECLVNSGVHYRVDLNQHKMFIFNTINEDVQFELDFKINLAKPMLILKQCQNDMIINDYNSFLQEVKFKNHTKSNYKRIYILCFAHFLTVNKSRINLNITPNIITKLHERKKYKRIKDVATNKMYSIYFHGKMKCSEPKQYIIPLVTRDESIINTYNIRKNYTDIIIYNNLLFCLNESSTHVLIISLQSEQDIGKIKTYIKQSRSTMHLVINKRLLGIEYISIFAQRRISYDLAITIDSYLDIEHFKYELILFSRYTTWKHSGDDEIPMCINMNKIMKHLQCLCLV